MGDENSIPLKKYKLGEARNYRVQLHDEKNTDLSAGTGSLTIYDSAGSVVFGPTAMSLSGTNYPVLSYRITTGAAKNLTAAGSYTVKVTFTNGSDIRIWEGPLQVGAVP